MITLRQKYSNVIVIIIIIKIYFSIVNMKFRKKLEEYNIYISSALLQKMSL